MASATGDDAGELGLRLELAQRPGGPQARLHAGPALLGPGLHLASLVAEPAEPEQDARPRSTAALRTDRWRVLEARLEITTAALEQAVQRLVGGQIAGWPIGQATLELSDAQAVLTLTGPRDAGWPGVVQVGLTAKGAGGAIEIAATEVWATAPLAASGPGIWRAIARLLVAGREEAARIVAEVIEIDPGWALRRAFRTAGAQPPHSRRLQVSRVQASRRGLRIVLLAAPTIAPSHAVHLHVVCPDEHVLKDRVNDGREAVIADPLARLRAALRGGDQNEALRELARMPARTHAGRRRLELGLTQVRAELLRFSDRSSAAAALRAWLAAAPEDPEVWWRMAVQHRRAGEAEGLARALAALERLSQSPAARQKLQVARALVAAEQTAEAARVARASEPDSASAADTGEAEGEGVGAGEGASEADGEAAEVVSAGVSEAEGEVVRAGEVVSAAAGEAAGAVSTADAGETEREVGSAADRGEAGGVVSAGEGVREAEGEAVKVVSAGVSEAGVGEVVRAAEDTGDLEREAAELAAVALVLAREGALDRVTAAVAAAARRIGASGLHAAMRARAEQALDPGAVLVLAVLMTMSEETCVNVRGLVQLAGFMLPGVDLAPLSQVGELRIEADAGEPDPTIKNIVGVLQSVDSGGIRAPGAAAEPELAAEVQALADAALGPLRVALGLRLPLRAARGGILKLEKLEHCVAIRNERQPAIVVAPALTRLAAAERRFRLALAAVMIQGGLAVVLDPTGASLQELLAALHQVADPSEVPTLPGARTIVQVWTRRGMTGERLAPELRLALAEELRFWRQDGAHVAQLAALLRWHHIEQATRVSGALDGALLAIGRDRRLLEVHDEASARRVLASAEMRELLRAARVPLF